ncbi:hypothetical protein BC629DRAFT_227820 [Irpex lacteus]|nr:hypothetical protein BC629DRAFT_227820 [Irpex lacteus]
MLTSVNEGRITEDNMHTYKKKEKSFRYRVFATWYRSCCISRPLRWSMRNKTMLARPTMGSICLCSHTRYHILLPTIALTRQLIGSRTYTAFVKIKETSSLRYCAHCTACRQFLIMHRASCIMSWLILAIKTSGNYRLGVRRVLSINPVAFQASKFARQSRIWPAARVFGRVQSKSSPGPSPEWYTSELRGVRM